MKRTNAQMCIHRTNLTYSHRTKTVNRMSGNRRILLGPKHLHKKPELEGNKINENRKLRRLDGRRFKKKNRSNLNRRLPCLEFPSHNRLHL